MCSIDRSDCSKRTPRCPCFPGNGSVTCDCKLSCDRKEQGRGGAHCRGFCREGGKCFARIEDSYFHCWQAASCWPHAARPKSMYKANRRSWLYSTAHCTSTSVTGA